ncbi:MAG: Mur ligase family protein, partial [Verrucomicrobiales bacterium]
LIIRDKTRGRRSLDDLMRALWIRYGKTGIGIPGDMARMAGVAQPDLVIVTMVGIEHYSYFRSREAVAAEKGVLVESLRPAGVALLNGDDPAVMAMATRTRARIITFGTGRDCHYRISDVRASFPERMRMTISCARGEFEISTRFTGKHFSVPTAAAFAAAVELGLDPKTAATGISSFDPPINRCSVVEIPNGPIFILDALKAPSETISLSFEVIASARSARKTIIFGQLSDYSGNGKRVYRDAINEALNITDRVFFVAKEHHRSILEKMSKGRVVDDALAAFEALKEEVEPGEIILLKGSSSLHLERIVLAFQEEVKCRLSSCKIQSSCMECGLYKIPQSKHQSVLWRKKLLRLRDRIFKGSLWENRDA